MNKINLLKNKIEFQNRTTSQNDQRIRSSAPTNTRSFLMQGIMGGKGGIRLYTCLGPSLKAKNMS